MEKERNGTGFRLCLCRECFNYYLRRPAGKENDLLYDAYIMLKEQNEASVAVTSLTEERYCYDVSNAYEEAHILKLTAQRLRKRKNGTETITRLHFSRGDAYEETAVAERDCPYCGSDCCMYVSAENTDAEESVIQSSEFFREAVQRQYDRYRKAGEDPDEALLQKIRKEHMQIAYAYRDDMRSGRAYRWSVYRITKDPADCPYRKQENQE